MADWGAVNELVSFVRSMRSVCDIAPSRVLQCKITEGTFLFPPRYSDDIASLARVEVLLKDAEVNQPSVVKNLILNEICLSLYLPSDIDIPKIVGSLQDKLQQKRRWLAGAEKKLANQKFLSGAPHHIIFGLKIQVEEAEQDAKALEEQLAALDGSVE